MHGYFSYTVRAVNERIVLTWIVIADSNLHYQGSSSCGCTRWMRNSPCIYRVRKSTGGGGLGWETAAVC